MKEIVQKRLNIKKDIANEMAEVKEILNSKESDDVKLDSIRAIFEELAMEIVQAQTEKLYDARTGFLSAKFGEDFLDREIELSKRNNWVLSIALVDVDFLKFINDNFGHISGTKCILAVSDAIKKIIRKSDVVSRYGGDEFLIIYTGSDFKKAQKAVERLKKEIACVIIDEKLRVGVSIGLAQYKGSGDMTAEGLIGLADKELYKAKKNRINVNLK